MLFLSLVAISSAQICLSRLEITFKKLVRLLIHCIVPAGVLQTWSSMSKPVSQGAYLKASSQMSSIYMSPQQPTPMRARGGPTAQVCSLFFTAPLDVPEIVPKFALAETLQDMKTVGVAFLKLSTAKLLP